MLYLSQDSSQCPPGLWAEAAPLARQTFLDSFFQSSSPGQADLSRLVLPDRRPLCTPGGTFPQGIHLAFCSVLPGTRGHFSMEDRLSQLTFGHPEASWSRPSNSLQRHAGGAMVQERPFICISCVCTSSNTSPFSFLNTKERQRDTIL